MTPDERQIQKFLNEDYTDAADGKIIQVTGWVGNSKWRYSETKGWQLIDEVRPKRYL